MRKKYDYFINEVKVDRKEFIIQLQRCCQKVIYTDIIAGWCGVDLCEIDEHKYHKYMRSISKGEIVLFVDHHKSFRRKEAVK